MEYNVKNSTELPNGSTLHFREIDYWQAVNAGREVMESGRGESSVNGSYDFTGTQSMQEALNLATNGWEQGIRALTNPEIDPRANEISRPGIQLGVEGIEPDVAGYIAGMPEHMLGIDTHSAARKILNIVVALSQHADVDSADMTRRAQNVFVGCEHLRLAGYILSVGGLEYISSLGYYSGDETMAYHIPILRPGETIVPGKFAFSLGHPSFLRRIIFAVEELEAKPVRDTFGFYSDGGYGMSQQLDSGVLSLVSTEGDAAIVIDKDDGFERDPNDYITWLKSQLDDALSSNRF